VLTKDSTARHSFGSSQAVEIESAYHFLYPYQLNVLINQWPLEFGREVLRRVRLESNLEALKTQSAKVGRVVEFKGDSLINNLKAIIFILL
jgi:hypothetical protein